MELAALTIKDNVSLLANGKITVIAVSDSDSDPDKDAACLLETA